METVVSGIRPTGNLHLGNYFGAVKNFLKMQDEYKCFFFIADWHSLTTHPRPGNVVENVRKILAEYLACGLDPEKATIYVQSDIKEILELYLFLNMNAYLGELERTTTFKEKARKQPDNVNAGLLTYPTLMAADIIIHKAHKVPWEKIRNRTWKWPGNSPGVLTRYTGMSYFPNRNLFLTRERGSKYRDWMVPGRWESRKEMQYICSMMRRPFAKR